MDTYQTILESDLMDKIWNGLGATDKITVLEKSGWNMVDEFNKLQANQMQDEIWGSESDNQNGDSNLEREQ